MNPSIRKKSGYFFPLSVCLIYLVISLMVKDFYPFSTFSMFSQTQDSTSRIFAQKNGGKLEHVQNRVQWNCPGDLKKKFKACSSFGEFGYTPYQDQRDVHHVMGNRSAQKGGEQTRLFRRIWWISRDGRWHQKDCVISQCTSRARQ